MAFTGFNVIVGYADRPLTEGASQAILGAIEFSEFLAANTPSTNSVPALNSFAAGYAPRPIMRLFHNQDIIVDIGPSPDPAASPKRFVVPGGTPYDKYVQPGDKVAYILAT